jgi:hypothetical protein
MNRDAKPAKLSSEYWNVSAKQLADELRQFIEEFGSFTPEYFTQIKFHVLRDSGLSKESRDELCRVSIHEKLCPQCDLLYVAKKCLLWYKLFKLVNRKIIRRTPPCIRTAYTKKRIKHVANFLTKANIINPPFYKVRSAPSCKAMRRWGLCNPDEYCKWMKTQSTLEYRIARERVKQNRSMQR